MIAADQLRNRLLAANYTFEAVAEALGEHGQLGLARNQTMPAQVMLVDRDDALATLIRLFILQLGQPASVVNKILGEQPEIFEIRGEQAYALIDIRPYGSPDDNATGWVVSDLMPGLNGVTTPTRPDYVLGVSPASQTLTEMTIRRQVTSALDLGTGCGVQSLHLAQHAQRIVATDLNPRAVELARLTCALNQQDIEVVEGSLFEPVADQQFDLIVSNPPYVMSPPRVAGEKLTYREGGLVADELVRRVVVEGVDHLAPGGVVQVLANWVAQAPGAATGERIVGWLGDRDDIDILVMERERLDKFAYVEMWLTDAGLAGDPAWESRYQEWLAYFDELEISEISMGWIVVRRREEKQGERYVRLEQWPHAVSQPVGDAFMRDLDGVERSRRLSDAELLKEMLALREHIQEERYGAPGAADPASIVLRQQSGFCRGYLCTTQLAAVLGACDGELALGMIIDVVAQITDVDVDGLRSEVLGEVRELMQQGWFN